jgi:NAD(P)-dependent dehydrogenase (short-subunit alcohol dehydrogenase family)
MNLQLEGKRALVTGSTAGIGWAIAAGLAAEGAEVIVNGRTEARVTSAVQQIKARHPKARVRGIAADLGTADGCARMVREVPEVDVLVNNLGIFAAVPFEEIPDGDWMRFFEVNVLSGVRLARAYLPGMKAHNWGRILFISSESALQIPVEMIHYGTTKTAQLAVSRGLAETTRGTGVTVNAILAGPTRSEGVATFVEGLAAQQGVPAATVERDFFSSARPSSLLQRFATPEEVAAFTVFVASGPASAVNGAALRVDGGVVRAIV